jgi:anti-sigma regulatory factor (Ser/Thr protein kinase)
VEGRQVSQDFEPHADSVGLSRTFLGDLLALWEADELHEVAGLLTTELVANVVRHAVTNANVCVTWEDPTLRVEVRDGSSQLPTVRGPSLERDGGRGLLIVANLAREWGVRVEERGKAVWFTVDRDDGSDYSAGS